MQLPQICLALLFSFTCFGEAMSANIIVILYSPARSHFKPYEPLFMKLGERGHNVTVLCPFHLNYVPSQYNYLRIDLGNFSLGSRSDNWHQMTRLEIWLDMQDIIVDYMSNVYGPSILKILDEQLNEMKFDLIFIEPYLNDFMFAFSRRLNCPMIGLSFQPLLQPYHWLMKNPMNPSYVPHVYSPYSDTMNFQERVLNTLFGWFTIIFHRLWFDSQRQKEVKNKLFGDTREDPPSIDELAQNLSLILVESHFSSGYARPNLPNVIEVAGIHLPEVTPLPDDLQRFMDTAEHGVIFVSLGTLVNPEVVSEIAVNLMNVFRNIPQKVIWKWKSELLENIPSNMMVREWLPQFDILNHPNCKLFISHGGYHSLVESIYSGVPILGVPFFTDQHYNTAIILRLAIGKKASRKSSSKEILPIITELLTNETYTLNAQKQSLIFKDRPMSALDTAVYWTEYVLRHKGAPHLKSAATELYWFQYILLDVAIVLILICSVSVYMLKMLIVMMISIITQRTKCLFYKTKQE